MDAVDIPVHITIATTRRFHSDDWGCLIGTLIISAFFAILIIISSIWWGWLILGLLIGSSLLFTGNQIRTRRFSATHLRNATLTASAKQVSPGDTLHINYTIDFFLPTVVTITIRFFGQYQSGVDSYDNSPLYQGIVLHHYERVNIKAGPSQPLTDHFSWVLTLTPEAQQIMKRGVPIAWELSYSVRPKRGMPWYKTVPIAMRTARQESTDAYSG